MKTFRRMLCVFLLVFVAAGAFAQTGSSRITGSVLDNTGAVVGDATVTLTNEATNISQSTKTTAAGLYVFDGLQPGKYTVKVERTGFRTTVSTGNTLTTGLPLTVNAKLEVGAAQEVVEVSATAELVQTATSGNIGGLIDNQTLTALPLGLEAGTGGRNPLIFIRLQPGVNFGANTGGATHVNGSRDRAFNYTLDGIDINETSAGGSEFSPLRTNPDSLQEFRVITSNATAEYGRNSGAQVSLVTKSGTNNLHGNIFYFHRNSALAANEWFNNFNGTKRGFLLQHQYGGSVGGPIMKDKTFFFFNYQGQRQVSPVTRTRTVYTQSARQGIFRYLVGGRNRPANQTGAVVDTAGNPLFPACSSTVTTGCIATYNIFANDPRGLGSDPTMKAWFDLTSLPNSFLGGDGLNTAQFIFTNSVFNPQRDFVVKIDHKFSDNHTVYGRYAWGKQDTINDSGNDGDPKFPGLSPTVNTTRDPRNLAVNYRAVISPRMVNELVVGFNHFTFDFPNPVENQAPFSIIANTVTDPYTYTVSNKRTLDTYQIVDNWSYNFTEHFMKAGINFRYQRHQDVRGSIGGQNALPQVFFSAASNVNGSCPNGSPSVSATGQEFFCLPGTTSTSPNRIDTNDLSGLRSAINNLLGRVSSVTQGFVAKPDLSGYLDGGSLFINDARYPEYDFYVQDTWKARRNLTLDFGLRWELKLTPRAKDRLYVPNQPVGLGGTPTNTLKWVQGNLFESDTNNLSPSIGFAWDPWSDGKTAVRGNYRAAYDRLNTFVISSSIYNTIPGITFGASDTTFGTSGGPGGTVGRVRDGLPSVAPPATANPAAFAQPVPFGTGAITVIDPNLRAPLTHGWSLDIQRELPGKVLMEVSYIGRKAQNLFGAYNANQVDIRNNGFLEAYKVVAGGGESALINQIFAADSRRTSTQTGSQFMRTQYASSIAQNSVAFIANDIAGRTQGGVPLLQLAGLSPFFFRAHPQFATLNVIDSNDWSKYHAFQLVVSRKFSDGFQFQGSYTWAKSMDTRSYDPAFTVVSTGTNQSASSTPFDNFNRRLNYAPSDFDRRHQFVGYGVYDLPFGPGRRFGAGAPSFLARIIEGWNINGVMRLVSGRPFTVYTGANSLSQVVSTPANCTGTCDPNFEIVDGKTPRMFADASMFGFSAPGEVGNTGRNAFYGPRFFNIDAALLKRTSMPWEGHNLELRFEFFNLTNSPSFNLPNSTISSSTFGQITSTTTEARKVRVGAKYNF